LIDDDPSIHRSVAILLKGRAEIVSCLTAHEAVAAMRSKRFDVALVDIDLGEDISGHRLIERLRENDPDLACVVLTGLGDYKTVIDSIGVHAFDFVPKSLMEDRKFVEKIGHAAANTRGQRARSSRVEENGKLKASLESVALEKELGDAERDLHRTLFRESTESLSALAGHAESIDSILKREVLPPARVRELRVLSKESLEQVHSFAGVMRDYYSQPGRAIATMNDILLRAVRIVHGDPADLEGGRKVYREELRPNRVIGPHALPLHRSVVALLRLALRAAPAGATVVLRPFMMLDPSMELRLWRLGGRARVLVNPGFRQADRVAFAVEVVTPARPLDLKVLEAALKKEDVSQIPYLLGATLVMCRHMKAALAVELLHPASTRFCIVLYPGLP
jgi:DNA-binding NarL/FixJ family response regulator